MDQNNASEESLAAIVVAYRSLGIFEDKAKEAMIELSKRKENGSSFDYEKYIQDKLSLIPKPNFNSDVFKFIRSVSLIGSLEEDDK